ncbi:pirin domain-containing protein [Infundibulicybe gibba]|nr:pirin domain-containing protein [Infundibulicybe gibba]
MKFLPRRSEDRGHADHGWLKTFHTFSFAMYQDYQHNEFGPLRVINEDRVAPRTGFGTHSHREFEIFSYIVSGELEHKDSLGNTEILKRGALQMTSTGTGISHSEKSPPSSKTPVHFLQIWSHPHTPRLTPKYYTRYFTDAEKQNNWVRVVAPVGSDGVVLKRDAEGPAPVQSQLTMYAALVGGGKKMEPRKMAGKKGYVHVIQTSGYVEGKAKGASIKVVADGQELTLREGDGVYVVVRDSGEDQSVEKALEVENVGDTTAEILIFDLE